VSRRGADPGAIAAALPPRVRAEALEEPRAALRVAVDRAGANDAVLVTGSLFLVGEAYAMLGGRGSSTELFQPWKPPEADATQAGS
jgi:folylpolyglutamate synthase/dihydropteroate synthase